MYSRFLGLGLGTLGLGFIGSGLGRGVDGLALGLRGGLSTLGGVRWRDLTLRIHVGVPLSSCHSTRGETNGSEGVVERDDGRGVDGLAFGLRGELSTLGEVRWRD